MVTVEHHERRRARASGPRARRCNFSPNDAVEGSSRSALGLQLTLAAAPSPPHPSYGELFGAMWQTIDQNFHDPSFGGVDWAAMRRRYKPEVSDVKSDSAFLALACRMMGELHASHLELVPPQMPQAGIGARFRKLDGHPSLRWRIIDQGAGQIGYIKADPFDHDAAPLIDAALDAMRGCYGLIIDLRENSGGNMSSTAFIQELGFEP